MSIGAQNSAPVVQSEMTRIEPGIPVSPPNQKAFSQWLDFFRWMSALAVVFAHSENRFLVRLTDVDAAHRTIPFYLFSFIAGFAHPAVMIFFVLSGYLVGGGLWQEARRHGSIDLSQYFVKRVSRLCIVLYPAFLLIAALNLFSTYAFHGAPTGSMGPSSLACNAAFFETSLCNSYGGDGALWSLFNEFWYYVAWPLLVLAWLVRTTWMRTVLIGSACVLLTLLTLTQSRESSAIGPYMLIWILGVGVAAAPRPFIRSCLASAALFGADLMAVRILVRRTYGDVHPVGMFFVDLSESLLFANLLISMKHYRALASPIGHARHTWLAAFSFSLYCIHTPILNLYASAFRHYSGQDPKMLPDHLWTWGVIFGAMALSIIGAFLFSRLTEAHTVRLRTFILDILQYGRRNSIAAH
jgi:peptidoglycan/LPS O-acetylase OafA/YrhL